jgi:hypothetical protein
MSVELHVLESFIAAEKTVEKNKRVHEFLASQLVQFNASEYRATWNKLRALCGLDEKSDSSTRTAIDALRHVFAVIEIDTLSEAVRPGIAEEASGRATKNYKYVPESHRANFKGLACPDEILPLIAEYQQLMLRAEALRDAIGTALTPHTYYKGCGLFDTAYGPVMVQGGKWFRPPNVTEAKHSA